ncbi:LysE/ArgO family amino acid transporter [Brevibacterium album]|uniref:LysE/ArgO family amino acid transporter n=1 Tax=Brevibacterium album TaxID=417948 RepID=UPI00040515A8|nr:LysE/ArgO family amino acid transporter [Brevibacterium album]
MDFSALPLALTGFATGLGLIVAIGAQNAFVLRQGIRREHVGVVVTVCALVDIALITLGTAGIGAVLEHAPWLVAALRWGGVAYLLWFAFGSVRSAFSGGSLEAGTAAQERSAAPSALRIGLLTASLSLLNPHVYLDTVVMLGSIANQQEHRWVFAGGAITASLAWFSALGWGAHRLAPALRSPRAWLVIDLCVAAVMVLIAAKLAFGF